MNELPLTNNFYHIMQISIGPVVLISGVGLLVLAITNQFGRVIDRARKLNAEYHISSTHYKAELARQLTIVWKRAGILRLALACGILCVLFVALLIFSLFVFNILMISAETILISIFLLSMLSLIGCLVSFIRDINISLHALKVELDNKDKDKS